MKNKEESLQSYKMRRAKKERLRMQKHKTSSIKKITYLLRRGWDMYRKSGSVTAYSNACTWGWRLSHPDWSNAWYEVSAVIVDKLHDLDILIYINDRNAKLKLDKHILICSRGCKVDTRHTHSRYYKRGDACPSELSHDIMHGGTTYCRRKLF